MTVAYKHIEVSPVAGALGAEVAGVDLTESLGNEVFSELHDAFMEHLVLFFRGQDITPAQHIAFARRFGEIDPNPFVRPLELETLPDHPEVLNVVKEASDRSMNFGGLWHHDVSHRERPNLGSVLLAREAPAAGGDTMWANQYLAYNTLSDGLKKTLGGMKAVHSTIRDLNDDQLAANYGVKKESVNFASVRRAEDKSEKVEHVHPVIRTHPETGRKCLFVNRSFTQRFDGWTREESLPLLDYLWAHGARPEFTVRWRWQAGDAALWDNRCVLHNAINDYAGQRRVMNRVAIHGDRPY
jgi:taurine dioxygenase